MNKRYCDYVRHSRTLEDNTYMYIAYLGNKSTKAWLTVTLVFFVNELVWTNRVLASRARETSFMIGGILVTNFLFTRKKLLLTFSTILWWINSATLVANQIFISESESFIQLKNASKYYSVNTGNFKDGRIAFGILVNQVYTQFIKPARDADWTVLYCVYTAKC